MRRDDTFLFPAAEAATVMKADQDVINGGHLKTIEENVTTADGNKTTFLSNKGPIFDQHRNLIGLFGIARNITDRKRAEEALFKSQKLESLGLLAGGPPVKDALPSFRGTGTILVMDDEEVVAVYGSGAGGHA